MLAIGFVSISIVTNPRTVCHRSCRVASAFEGAPPQLTRPSVSHNATSGNGTRARSEVTAKPKLLLCRVGRRLAGEFSNSPCDPFDPVVVPLRSVVVELFDEGRLVDL